MQTYTITSDQNRTGKNPVDFHVHAAGCADIEREIKRAKHNSCRSWDVEAESAEAAIVSELANFASQDMDFTRDDYHVCPCCKRK